MKIKTAIMGGSGYTGAELLRLLASHPNFEVSFVSAYSDAGKPISEVYPHLLAYEGLEFQPAESSFADFELVFCALPHGESMGKLPALDNKVIVDIGSDFRLIEPNDYEQWYGTPHSAPAELGKWAYALPELFKAEILASKRLANPGCYPTASNLALAPLIKPQIVEPRFSICAMSGTSGAGKVPKPGLHFSHTLEDVSAYGVGRHRHTPEIEMALSKFAGQRQVVNFTPHLVPSVRGIHATCEARLSSSLTQSQCIELYKDFYANCPFVKVSSKPLGTKTIRGSNYAYICPTVDVRTKSVIVTSVIDNLVKGASGQAIQNANIAFGLEETSGLEMQGLYP